MNKSLTTMIFLLSFLLSAVWSAAQSSNLSISAQVVGVGKGPLAGVELSLLSSDRETIRVQYSDSRGRYTFADLAPSTYQLEARFEGFVTVRKVMHDLTAKDYHILLTLEPEIDIEQVSSNLTAEDYSRLTLRIFEPGAGTSVEMEVNLSGGGIKATRKDYARGTVRAKSVVIRDWEDGWLRDLLGRLRLLEANHVGADPRETGGKFETLEVRASGLVAPLVVSGNPYFAEGPARDLTDWLAALLNDESR